MEFLVMHLELFHGGNIILALSIYFRHLTPKIRHHLLMDVP